MLVLSRTNSPALAQMREIVELQKDWPPENLNQEDDLRTKFDSANYIPIPEHKTRMDLTGRWPWRTPQTSRKLFHLRFEGPYWIPMFSKPDPRSIFSYPKTLVDFQSWWDELARPHPYYFPVFLDPKGIATNHTWVGPAEGSDDKIEVTATQDLNGSETTVTGPRLELLMRVENDGTAALSDGKPLVSFNAKDEEDNRFELHVHELRKANLDQGAVLQVAGSRGWKWKKGPFAQSFSALSRETSGLEAEDLENVEKVLAERLATKSEEFEAFGMKVAIAQVTIWGTVILLGVQLYMLLYLKQLSGKLGAADPAWDVPWICMDQSAVGQVVSFVSLVLLPLGTMLFIISRASQRLTQGYLIADPWRFVVPVRDWDKVVLLQLLAFLFATISALLLGVFSWRYRPRLKNAPAMHCPTQLFE